MKTKILAILLAFFVLNCGTLRFSRYNSFGEWFIGDPGYRGMYFGYEPADKDRWKLKRGCNSAEVAAVATVFLFFWVYYYHIERSLGFYDDPNEYEDMFCSNYINEYRQPLYLWLRSPEIIFNPQGATHFPEVWERKFSKTHNACIPVKRYLHGDKIDLEFHVMDAGILDAAIPYRVWNSNEWEGIEKFGFTIINPFIFLPANIFIKAFQLPFIVVNDVSKIILVPIAATYYDNRKHNK